MAENKDKFLEKERYEQSSKSILLNVNNLEKLTVYEDLPEYLQEPYHFYKKKIQEIIQKQDKVLEIGSGRGDLTGILLSTGANITATDISPLSLEILNKRYSTFSNLETSVQDMENLDYENKFDVFCSAGSLSYGSLDKVLSKAKQALKPGGYIICVDSLNDNPVYKIKRYIDFFRNRRSISTILNMPTIKSLLKFNGDFQVQDLKFFGSLSWFCKLAEPFADNTWLATLSRDFDERILVKGSAYKFVIIAKLKSK